jgi:hypothetical protein
MAGRVNVFGAGLGLYTGAIELPGRWRGWRHLLLRSQSVGGASDTCGTNHMAASDTLAAAYIKRHRNALRISINAAVARFTRKRIPFIFH